jgi:rod shape-determining protein MreC
LIVLVALSLLVLASGMRAAVVVEGVRAVVAVAAEPFLELLHKTQGAAAYVAGFVAAYDAGRAEVYELKRELAELVPRAASQAELEAENRRLRVMLDFVRSYPGLTLEPVEVLAVSVEGTLTIDRGSMHGIRPSMCVLDRAGVVGLVTRVLPTVSYVSTLHHSDCKIGAVVRRNRVRGVIHGSGSAFSHICTLNYIDLKDRVQPGDEVITSGGAIYPAGLPIGTVKRVDKTDASLLATAVVEPYANPYELDEVLVVRLVEPSAEELAGTERQPEVVNPVTDPMVENASVQERYAP